VLGAEIVVTWDCCFGNAGQPCGYRYFKFPHHSLSFCYRFLMLESFHCCILGVLGVGVVSHRIVLTSGLADQVSVMWKIRPS
jgi:hypothetical protein